MTFRSQETVTYNFFNNPTIHFSQEKTTLSDLTKVVRLLNDRPLNPKKVYLARNLKLTTWPIQLFQGSGQGMYFAEN